MLPKTKEEITDAQKPFCDRHYFVPLSDIVSSARPPTIYFLDVKREKQHDVCAGGFKASCACVNSILSACGLC